MPSIGILGCYVTVDTDCTPSGQSTDCGSVVVTRTRCEDRPLAMVFRYNGGTCDQSDNIQNSDLFQCFDFQGGPPVVAGETSYITVTDIKGGQIIYHADTVAVGGEYTVADELDFQVEANMNVTTWRNSNMDPLDMLQTLVFHSSCSQNLFLKDRFGAHQLVVFVNEEQGLQSCFFNATFTLTIDNDVRGTGAILETLTSNTNYGLFDFSEQYKGTILEPGTTLTPAPSFDVVIDLTVVTNNVVFTTITANSEQGFFCGDSDFVTFVTGLALPPNVPTRAPTSAPTITPLPTPDPETTACQLQAIVSCDVTNAAGLFECDNIVPPTSTQCLSGGFPRELEFIYRGGDCPGTTSQNFACQGSANLDEVWITIISGNNNILWNQITTRDSFMDLRGVDQSVEVTISTVENGRVGEEIQSMTFNTTCTSASGLRLKDTFGALELVEFTTVAGDGSVAVNAAFANVAITYAVELQAGTAIRASVTSASSVGGLVTDQTTTSYPPPPEVIGPQDTHVFGRIETVIDLMNLSGSADYRYNLEVSALSASNSNLDCSSSDLVQFNIN